MGHTIIGDLPKSQRWQVVATLLQSPEVDPADVAAATVAAAERRLVTLRRDPSLTYGFWLLTRLASAARGPDFLTDVAQLGVPAQPDDTVLTFIARVHDHARVELNRYPESGPYGEIASLALRGALAETVGTAGRSLFGSSLEDLEGAFRRHSTAAQFGELAHRYFTVVYARTLRFYVDRALSTSIRPGGGLASVADARAFGEALDRHARQSARIVERFGAEWFVKHHWGSDGAISREEAGRFTAHALTKLRKELLRDASS